MQVHYTRGFRWLEYDTCVCILQLSAYCEITYNLIFQKTVCVWVWVELSKLPLASMLLCKITFIVIFEKTVRIWVELSCQYLGLRPVGDNIEEKKPARQVLASNCDDEQSTYFHNEFSKFNYVLRPWLEMLIWCQVKMYLDASCQFEQADLWSFCQSLKKM